MDESTSSASSSNALVPEDSAECHPKHDETLDLMLKKRIYLLQSKKGKGFRASTDSVILPYFTVGYYPDDTHVIEKCTELGGGSGLVSILLLKHFKQRLRRLDIFEIQPMMADRCRRNMKLNGVYNSEVTSLIMQDIAEPINTWKSNPELHSYDLVVSNPPFYDPLDKSRVSPSAREKSIAFVESSASIYHFVERAAELMRPDGSFFTNYPVDILHRLTEALDQQGMRHVELRYMYHRFPESETAKRVLLRARFSDSPTINLIWLPPIILHPGDNNDNSIYVEPIEQYYLSIAPAPEFARTIDEQARAARNAAKATATAATTSSTATTTTAATATTTAATSSTTSASDDIE